MTIPFDAATILDGLKPFQRATVEHVERRLFLDDDCGRRFLVADETGLGKSLVARGVIATTIEHLRNDSNVDRIDIIYVCSNTDIVDQNLKHLDVLARDGASARRRSGASRLTLLARDSQNLEGDPDPRVGKRVNLISFTPGTSFSLGHTFGSSEERALLHVLLSDELAYTPVQQRRARIVLQGNATKHFGSRVDTMRWRLDREPADEQITRPFLHEIRRSGLLDRFDGAVESIGSRRRPTDEEWHLHRSLVGDLRSTLAKVAVEALKPDLIILDEFQRFRHLLDPNDPHHWAEAELAHSLFDHGKARVLLLSATPYKPFTYAEERDSDDDHERDLKRTLGFLAGGGQTPGDIVSDLVRYRTAIVNGEPTETIRHRLETSLTRLMCRTERPQLGDDLMLAEHDEVVEDLPADDLVAYASLADLARRLDAPVNIDYWKSVPYFVNFGDGYRVMEELREALSDPHRVDELRPILQRTQRLDPGAVARLEPIEPGNARLRRLLDDTIHRGWWRLLWMPPSLPYDPPDGPYAEPAVRGLSKRLIFSSWAATPTAIASIVSHEALCLIAGSSRRRLDAASQRFTLARRRLQGEWRPAEMSAFMLFWPSPRIARSNDPLTTAFVPSGAPTGGPNSSHWYWETLFVRGGSIPSGLDIDSAVLAMAGGEPAEGPAESERAETHAGIKAHVERAVQLERREFERDDDQTGERPADLQDTLAELGRYAPGNIALRCIDRLVRPGDDVSELARWEAAAIIASGVRSIFNRPEATLLLENELPDVVAWRAVLRYCRWGNLEAVLDEYLHHVAGPARLSALDDAKVRSIAAEVRAAITPRPSAYTAFDPLAPDERITFMARFALRFGNKRGTDSGEGMRMPEIRAAFNSPFWPFVLATTSVGQEGVDFHWWCRTAVHWNTPASPVDFEQREGRVHRYGGLAIRQNLAAEFGDAARAAAASGEHPWDAAYRLAAEAVSADGGDMAGLKPHWIAPGPSGIVRQLYLYPLSRDHARYRQLKDDLTLYRLTFGQPRQEDLIELLKQRGVGAQPEAAAALRLDLRPPSAAEMSHRSTGKGHHAGH